jgi:hypothetical protein
MSNFYPFSWPYPSEQQQSRVARLGRARNKAGENERSALIEWTGVLADM